MQRRLVEAHAAAEKQGARAVAAPVQPVGPIADFLERELLERARGSAGRVRDLVPRAARQQRHVARLQPGPFHARGAQPRFARADEVKPRCALVGEADAPGLRQLAAPVRDAREPESCRTSLSGSGGMTWPSDEWLSICDEPSWNARTPVDRIPPTFNR